MKKEESPLDPRGSRQAVKDYIRWLQWEFSQKGRSKRTFAFNGARYTYFSHNYNRTWNNERAVEIPIISDIVQRNRFKRILEVGNVFSHYFKVSHDVLDKFEQGESIINEDIVNFHPAVPYDLIVSVSTFEHVGWDEIPRDPGKAIRAICGLKNLLINGGSAVLTVPVGHNPVLDQFIKGSTHPFYHLAYLKRISEGNDWIEENQDAVLSCRYGTPFPAANGVVVCFLEKVGHHAYRR